MHVCSRASDRGSAAPVTMSTFRGGRLDLILKAMQECV